jgi:hypothetical protein
MTLKKYFLYPSFSYLFIFNSAHKTETAITGKLSEPIKLTSQSETWSNQ